MSNQQGSSQIVNINPKNISNLQNPFTNKGIKKTKRKNILKKKGKKNEKKRKKKELGQSKIYYFKNKIQ